MPSTLLERCPSETSISGTELVQAAVCERVTSLESLKTIGIALQNCLAEAQSPYIDTFKNGSLEFWTLTDQFRQPVVVLAVEGNRVIEVKGFANSIPHLYRERLRSFLVQHSLDNPRDPAAEPSQLSLLPHYWDRPGCDILELGLYGSMARYPDHWAGQFDWKEETCLVRFDALCIIVQVGLVEKGWIAITDDPASGIDVLLDHVERTSGLVEVYGQDEIADLVRALGRLWPDEMARFARVHAVAQRDQLY